MKTLDAQEIVALGHLIATEIYTKHPGNAAILASVAYQTYLSLQHMAVVERTHLNETGHTHENFHE